MQAFGHEYPLVLTVGALEEITALCPDGDITRLGEVIQGPTQCVLAFVISMIAALSRGAEQQRRFQALAEGTDYAPNPITPEMLRALPPKELNAARAEAYRIWSSDQRATVETDTAKKNEDGAPAPSSG